MQLLLLIVLPFCMAAAFLCAGMEAGIFTLGRWRIAQQMRAGQARAARLYAYLQNTENFLWTVFVGNTIAVFCALWIVAVALIHVFPGAHAKFWFSFFGATFLFYAFCDLLPKTLFRKFPNRLCLVLSAPFRLLHIVLSPVVALIEAVTNLLLRWTGGRTYKGHVFKNRNELRLLMEDTQALSSEERGLINRVFDLHNITVRQITLSFLRLPGLQATDTMAEAVARFQKQPQNVMTVWSAERGARKVAGFLELKRFLFTPNLDLTQPVSRHVSRPMIMDEDLRVHDALRRMQRAGTRIAVVISRDNREIGLVTLEEIIKVIFGEVKL
jgi:CBS domain containing-hemolysin-like protein